MDIKTLWLLIILGAPLVTAGVLVAFRLRVARAAGWIAGVGVALPVIATFALVPVLYHGGEPALAVAWIPSLDIELDLHVDWLTLPFLMTEAGVSLLAVVYAWGYHHQNARTSYFYALLLLFAVGMAGTTLADDMFLFYVFWELMLIASCILILGWGDGEQRGAVALKYFIFTHMGSLLVLAALVMLYDAAGTDRFSVLRAGVMLPTAQVPWLVIMLLIGFCVKMAIFPLHLWLPDAHTVAPMPVTIMLAAAMLSMGTYGILRFPLSLFTRAQMQPFAVPMMIAGVVSEIYGALMALAEQDVKRVVAYSSVSQMGYILFGLGTLTYNGIAGATLHVIFHAIVKALLFMVLGLVIHATGKRKVSELGGLGRKMPVTALCAAVG
ncbi:MAG: NADH-quinone oxidoreductase subunit M, partial [Anaerolineae bacterium]|nr:NADH-quinone oxidoreductase subunit M [Anaerolineae bacterium]